MMRRVLILFSVFLIGLSCIMSGTANAQTQVGTVQGKVVDQQGGVLPGVTVELSGPMGTKTAVTDTQGDFRFVGCDAAAYIGQDRTAGFMPQQREGRRQPGRDTWGWTSRSSRRPDRRP